MKKIILFAAFVTLTTTLSGQSFFGFSYSTAAPLGETADYIGSYSWRGLNMEYRWFVSENISTGVFFNWNTFYQKLNGEFVDGTRTVSGTQQRFINVFPVMVEGHYYFADDFSRFRPYAGVGLGGQFTRQRTEMGIFLSEQSNWQFVVAPSVGSLIGFGGGTSLNLALRYYYAPQAGDLRSAISYLGVSAGLAWGN